MIVDINKKWIELYKKYYDETKTEAIHIENGDYFELLNSIKRKEEIIKKIDSLNVNNSLVQQGVEKEILIKIQSLERKNNENAKLKFDKMKKEGNERKKRVTYIKEYIK
ncbi:MAG: hypothetical protein JXQ23_07705 [Clostridia bacterium]|nr:hypothetical protein [Clostridia bacterium]